MKVICQGSISYNPSTNTLTFENVIIQLEAQEKLDFESLLKTLRLIARNTGLLHQNEEIKK